jgi:hypothetical protein
MGLQIILAVLGGSALAALINQIGEFARQKAKKKDSQEETENKDMTALKQGMKFIMLDRIKWLGQSYIKSGEISFNDRRLLNEMHGVYHNGLGGNGDLDTLMREVNELSLKVG